MFPRLSCRQAALLITTRRDRSLPLHERAALRLHLLVCKACPRFDRQIRLIDDAMGQWRHYADQGEHPRSPPTSGAAP